MQADRNKWVKMPKWLAEVYRMSGEQMRLTAVDLINEAIEMSGLEFSRRHERPECRNLGYQVVSWMLQPLAAEYPLKSLSITDASGFSGTHDPASVLCHQAETARGNHSRLVLASIPVRLRPVNAPTQEIAMVHARSFLGTRATGPVARGSPFLDELVLSGSGQLRHFVLSPRAKDFPGSGSASSSSPCPR